MSVGQKYKIYASIFFAFVVFYGGLFYYSLKVGNVNIFSLFNDNFLLFFFIIIFLFRKTKHYIKKIKNDFYGPSKYSDINIFSLIKSMLSIFIYTLFNFGAIQLLVTLLEDKNYPTLIKILEAQYIIFPLALIIWEFKILTYARNIKKEEIQIERKKHLKYAENMEKYTNLAKSKENGLMTGYEPRKLQQVMIKSTPLMKGEPGIGLSGSGFSEGNIKSGALGELNFAKILQQNNFLDKFATHWSAQYPSSFSPGPDNISKADIDCLIITKNTLFLIDIKMYSQGNVTWKILDNNKYIYAEDNITGNFAYKPTKMSQNMSKATERFKSKLDLLGVKIKVQPYVVMLPTDRGIGNIENVYWPGNIKCISVMDMLAILEMEKPFDSKNEDAMLLDSVFKWVLKDESGSAPKFDFN